ncbi:unnamed protein product [Diatraea saccharalis]|uniref:DNA-3-methyladenine glycosylase I n=1 Tax=Diatraea saccharalis TaxID=40085 RepID=A0A9N9W8B2_9NEOP|nr:unnamed protein product [Diatraea saccharalis]
MIKRIKYDFETASFTRCEWVSKDPIYIEYHDKEWGIPVFDSLKLFEMLCLEGQQAGLSWITILKKRENYRNLFHCFNPYEIIKFSDEHVKRLLTDIGIVRHKGKIEAIINNSKCYIQMEKQNECFSDFIWSFVNHKPIVNDVNTSKELKTETATSIALSKELKKKGFKFVGSTICYSFMQACGLVNDHINTCICKTKEFQSE